MTKRVLNREQRGELEGHLAAWGEWNRSNSSGYAQAQWLDTPSGEFGTAVPYSDSIAAIEQAMSALRHSDERGAALVVWLWVDGACCMTKRERCEGMQLHESSYDRLEDRAYVVIWNRLVQGRVIGGRLVA